MIREDEHIEFKKTTSELNQAMLSISAILNKHRRGTLYFGMRNDGTPIPFTINESTLRDVSRKIYESIKPQIFPVVETEVKDGVEIIRVDFEGDEIPYSALGKYYIRVADEDRELSPAELKRIMIGREYEENWESTISNETLKDVDADIVRQFYDKALQSGRMPNISFSVEGVLNHFMLIKEEHLTNAGRALFSSKKPITLKMAIFATEYKETFIDIQKVEGNIFELIEEAIGYIKKNIRWRARLNEDGIHRDEIPEVPIEAVREAVINSLVHARYDISIQHEIDIFPNKIMIVNPGSYASEHSPQEYAELNLPSSLRNETIAHVLYCCEDVESFGTGFRKIYSLCDEAGVKVSYSNHEMDFMIDFSRETLNKSTTIMDNITESEEKVIAILKQEPYLSGAEISERAGLSRRTVTRVITSLREKGVLVREGSNKKGQWRVL